MTIPNDTHEVTYTAAGTASETFTVPFRFLKDADLDVFLDGTIQTLDTNYSLTGAGDASGGGLTWIGTPTATKAVLIVRNPSATQDTDYVEGGAFPAQSHEDGLDKLTMLQHTSLRRSSSDGSIYDAKSHRITNVTDPTATQDAATKGYVNTQVAATTTGSVSGPAITEGDANKCLQVNAEENAVDWTGLAVPAPVTADINKVLAATAENAFSWQSLATDTYALNMRNLLINGAFTINQRKTTYTDANDVITAAKANNNNLHIQDGWILLSNGDNIIDVDSYDSSGESVGAYRAFRGDQETADKAWGISQIVNQYDTAYLAGGKASLSFSAKTSDTGQTATLRAAIRAWSGDADAPTQPIAGWHTSAGTNPAFTTSDYAATNTPSDLTLTASWQRFKIENITIPANATNLSVLIWTNDVTQDAGSFVYITNVQLQKGVAATDYMFMPQMEELARCQQYFAKSYNQGLDPGSTVTWTNDSVTGEQHPGTAQAREPAATAATAYKERLNTRLPQTMYKTPTDIRWFSPHSGERDRLFQVDGRIDHAVGGTYHHSQTQTGIPVLSTGAGGVQDFFAAHWTAVAELVYI